MPHQCKLTYSIDVFNNHVKCVTKEVQKLLNFLNANTSCGVEIPARLLKETADTSAVPLTMLFTLSIKEAP